MHLGDAIHILHAFIIFHCLTDGGKKHSDALTEAVKKRLVSEPSSNKCRLQKVQEKRLCKCFTRTEMHSTAKTSYQGYTRSGE